MILPALRKSAFLNGVAGKDIMWPALAVAGVVGCFCLTGCIIPVPWPGMKATPFILVSPPIPANGPNPAAPTP
jgi:hypothetical protein